MAENGQKEGTEIGVSCYSSKGVTFSIYPEGKETRFYIRTQTLTTVSFHVQYLPCVEQSLFCKISGLLYEPYHIEYYKSDPFNVTCMFFNSLVI